MYLDQAIPPAVGMPPYHLHACVNAGNFEPSMLLDYINCHNHSSGACMNMYAHHFEISQIASSLRKLIPHQGREGTDGEFKFQNENDVGAMFNSQIPSMLNKNQRPQNGEEYSYYKWIGEFSHRATVQWRGKTERH